MSHNFFLASFAKQTVRSDETFSILKPSLYILWSALNLKLMMAMRAHREKKINCSVSTFTNASHKNELFGSKPLAFS